MLARAPASPAQGPHHHGPRYFNFPYFCTMCGLEKLGIVDQNWLNVIIIIIIIISAHKSDLSSSWSQTQASLSIPSLHPKKQIKEEKERKNNRRESLPRSDRRGGGNKTRVKTKKAKTRHTQAYPRDK